MRIAQISTCASPVQKDAFGSVEHLVWLLTRELTKLGHEVTVFGTAQSQVDGKMAVTLPGPYGENDSPDDWQLCEWINLCRAVEESGCFDVMHSHAYLWGLPLETLSRAPMVHTMHIVPDENAAHLWSSRPNAWVTGISKHQWSRFPQFQPASIIPHGVNVSDFSFQADPGDYVCYLGRFTPGKGPLKAISAAQALGMRLVLAGPRDAYFREKIEPLVDGRTVEYVGFVKGAERTKLLGGAKALLYPIQYPEAFGLVLVESMLCGTPPVALNMGAVPEIIDQGITGFYTETEDHFIEAIRKAFTLDRRTIRTQAEQRFSLERMVQDYLCLYQEVIDSRL